MRPPVSSFLKILINFRAPCLLLVSLLIPVLAGCDWAQLLSLRSQMGNIYESTAWEGKENAVFVFKKPLLTIKDLNAFEVYPAVMDERNALLRYQRIGAPPDTPVGYEIRLRFIDGKLAGLVLPPSLREGLGPDNIRRLFALIGARNDGKNGLNALPKAQLVSAGLFPGALGREAVIDLVPVDSRNRPIYIKMTETQRAGYYSDFFISVKRRNR